MRTAKLASAGIMALATLLGEAGFAADLPGRHRTTCKCPKPKPPTCEEQASRLAPVANTFESTVVIAFAPKSCFLPDRLPKLVAVGQTVSITIRHVYNTSLFVPLGGRELRLSVVDSFGFADPKRILNAERIRTTNNGFSDREIQFRAFDPGVYRIRIDYTDRDHPNFMMSPNIIVTGAH